MKRCKNCGQENTDDATFCKSCGTSLAVHTTTENTAAQTYPQQDIFESENDEKRNPFSYFIDAFKNYAKFSGRASRKQYWMFTLFSVLIGIALGFIGGFLGGFAGSLYASGHLSYSSVLTISSIVSFLNGVLVLYQIAIFIPALAICWRRLHDINKSGLWFFIILIPIVGIIWLIVLLCQTGDEEENEYGLPPQLEESNSVPQNPSPSSQQKKVEESQESTLKNDAKIIRVAGNNVSVGCGDGSFFNVSAKELDFEPVVGDRVFVFTNGDEKIVTKTKWF